MSIPVSACGFGRRLRITYWLILAILTQGTFASGSSTKGNAASQPPIHQKESKLPAPLRLRVVVPYGGNMPGFMNYRAPMGAAPTEFQRRVGGLLTAIGKAPAKLVERTFVTTDGVGNLIPSNYAELTTLVDGKKPRLQYAFGLALPPLLADAVAAFDKDNNTVTILVTDLTHNGGGPKSLSSLPQDVAAAMIGTNGPVPFSVYAEASHFVGTYFPAMRSAPKKGTDTSIPYYIWIIGKPSQISRVVRQYLPNPPERQAHVGLTYSGLAIGALLMNLPQGSRLQAGGDGSVYMSAEKATVNNVNEGVEFSIGLDLHQLPSEWQKFAFLNSNLRVRVPGGTVVLIPKSVRWLTPAEHAASSSLNPYTHTARVRLTKLAPNASTLTFSLPVPELPAWPGLWTTATDQPPGLNTFRLKQILEGARQAHGEGTLPAVFSVSISLVNEED